MRKIAVLAVLSALCGVSVSAYSQQKEIEHSNHYGMGTFNGQYPQLISGHEKGTKILLAEQLYKQAMKLDSQKNGFDSNRTQAIQLWEEAAQYWHTPSRYEAGFAYYTGTGVGVDVPKANELLEYAARREHDDALGLYLVSQVYDSKYRKLTDRELVNFAQKSALSQNNVYGMLAYLKMHQDGTVKNQSAGRQQQIKDIIKLRLNRADASRVERNHIPIVISVLKINLN